MTNYNGLRTIKDFVKFCDDKGVYSLAQAEKYFKENFKDIIFYKIIHTKVETEILKKTLQDEKENFLYKFSQDKDIEVNVIGLFDKYYDIIINLPYPTFYQKYYFKRDKNTNKLKFDEDKFCLIPKGSHILLFDDVEAINNYFKIQKYFINFIESIELPKEEDYINEEIIKQNKELKKFLNIWKNLSKMFYFFDDDLSFFEKLKNFVSKNISINGLKKDKEKQEQILKKLEINIKEKILKKFKIPFEEGDLINTYNLYSENRNFWANYIFEILEDDNYLKLNYKMRYLDYFKGSEENTFELFTFNKKLQELEQYFEDNSNFKNEGEEYITAYKKYKELKDNIYLLKGVTRIIEVQN